MMWNRINDNIFPKILPATPENGLTEPCSNDVLLAIIIKGKIYYDIGHYYCNKRQGGNVWSKESKGYSEVVAWHEIDEKDYNAFCDDFDVLKVMRKCGYEEL